MISAKAITGRTESYAARTHTSCTLKEVSFHGLRHGFATHLLESDVDVRYIKDLLGHFDIETTECYLHVRKEQLIQINTPPDALFKNGNIELK